MLATVPELLSGHCGKRHTGGKVQVLRFAHVVPFECKAGAAFVHLDA
jgi:hypothetical protein